MDVSRFASAMEAWIDIPRTDEPELEAHLAPTCGFWWVDPEELAGGELIEPSQDETDRSDTERSDTHG
jgi:hypothetical protein